MRGLLRWRQRPLYAIPELSNCTSTRARCIRASTALEIWGSLCSREEHHIYYGLICFFLGLLRLHDKVVIHPCMQYVVAEMREL